MPFPPPAQKGMTQLNREAFKRVLKVYAVRIPAPKVMAFQKQIRRSVVETYHSLLLTPKTEISYLLVIYSTSQSFGM